MTELRDEQIPEMSEQRRKSLFTTQHRDAGIRSLSASQLRRITRISRIMKILRITEDYEDFKDYEDFEDFEDYGRLRGFVISLVPHDS